MKGRLKELYKKEVIPLLIKKFNYKNVHSIPKLSKIVINRGLGNITSKALETYNKELTILTGSKAIITKSKKGIASFKIRENMPIGVSVTLRNNYMYSFLDRLINLALPIVRDFNGLNPQSFDNNGNYSFGLKEQLMFGEIEYSMIDSLRGMDITIVTTAKTKEESLYLLKALGLPFKDSSN